VAWRRGGEQGEARMVMLSPTTVRRPPVVTPAGRPYVGSMATSVRRRASGFASSFGRYQQRRGSGEHHRRTGELLPLLAR
jgi:hypothetical protein